MIKRKFLFTKKDYDMIECENSYIIEEKTPEGKDITLREIYVITPPKEEK